MPSWFVRPETVRLPLSDGQWILVKQRLNTGEHRAHLARCSVVGSDGRRRVESLTHGLSLVVAYLLDWSLSDVGIRDASEAALTAALDNLEPDRFVEIREAVAAHELAMEAARETEKNVTGGERPASAISPSPSEPAGALSGSVN